VSFITSFFNYSKICTTENLPFIYNSVILITFTFLCNHLRYLSPQFSHLPKLKLCTHLTLMPHLSYPRPWQAGSVSEFDYPRYIIQMELYSISSFMTALFLLVYLHGSCTLQYMSESFDFFQHKCRSEISASCSSSVHFFFFFFFKRGLTMSPRVASNSWPQAILLSQPPDYRRMHLVFNFL
jgi:hypothetical protein